jgi:hypothetical protein
MVFFLGESRRIVLKILIQPSYGSTLAADHCNLCKEESTLSILTECIPLDQSEIIDAQRGIPNRAWKESNDRKGWKRSTIVWSTYSMFHNM